MVQGFVDGGDVPAVAPASQDQVPGRSLRAECQQDQAGPVRLLA
jgi:hypothetical protein